jgi:hypothetical protein
MLGASIGRACGWQGNQCFQTPPAAPSLRAVASNDSSRVWAITGSSYVASSDGTQPGAPRKAAAAILTALDASDPPLRLAPGADAVEAIRGKHERLRGDLEAWEQVSRETALDEATP